MSLEVREVTKHFYDPKRGEFPAVDHVSFSCEPGEIFGLLGPNGAGKTTTLRMIATILKPDSGTVVLDGYDIRENPEAVRRGLGFLSAETGLYERLTPREILTYFGQLSKYPESKLKERIEELIEVFEISGFADTRCEKLSTGMKQKVSIARAIVHDPPVMALDEPTSGLDVITSQATHRFIRECKERGKCIVFSTHIMSEAEKLCDRIGIIHKGRIFAMGTLEQLRKQTGEHYLEDIFLAVVEEKIDELV
ncbi:MAG TPA: ATP-binding cassette domain-containing protein [Candidatus Obscuribacterales bacterium]